MLVKLYDKNPNIKVLEQVVGILKDGGLIIYPTDSIYAIGCDIFQARAVENICRIKKENPRKASLSFICESISQISEYAKFDNDVFRLLKRNLPGPFTFILRGNSSLPKLFKQKNTVGVRIPDNNIVNAIVHELGHPLMSTTLHDENNEVEYTTDPELINERYGNMVDLVVDGGIGGLNPSTIIDCTSEDIEIVRQGIGLLK